ncbi:RagB/SusD family nutrient uptake outer membrane protein [Petrimonas sp.]|uniref:RagB/SusD family nutrient uptake outer membrane protein n=1 Tax=Petrimonas sp. TaxID=2023866 RepID=UPI003F51A075
MKLKYVIIAILFSVSISGCQLIGSIDDIKLENVLTDEELIVDAKSANIALNGVYASWMHIDIGWFINHLSILSRTINDAAIIGTEGFALNDVKEENEMLERNYLALYNVINMSNSVISKLEADAPKDIEASRLSEMVAEGRFHRAMAHLMLLRQYGEFYDLASPNGIVTYDAPARSNTPKARSSVKVSFEYILQDLEFAAKNAPAKAKGHYLVSRLTAKALQSRVLLYMHQFNEAATVAKSVITEAPAAGYALEGDYLDIFRKRFMSQEVLFSLFTSYPEQTSPIVARNTTTGLSFQNVADELVPEEKDLMTGTGLDPRFGMAFSELSVSMEGNATTGTNKYLTTTFGKGDALNTYFFLRLAEVYLIKAEADARMQRFDDARAALKTITDRAGYDESYVNSIADNELVSLIFKHKWMELAYENNEEWFDMVRLHKLDGMQIAPNYVATDRHLCLPIPRTALAGNNLIEQNTSYK